MKLRFEKQPSVRASCAQNVLYSTEHCRMLGMTAFASGFLLILCFVFSVQTAFSQQVRMVIDGSIRSDAGPLPPTTKIRVLHEDSSVDRTVQFYDPQSYRFGIRLSAQDGFYENEKIFFRVVVAPQDSFLARFVGPPLVFKGTKEPLAAPTTRVDLFRNTLPTVYRSLRDTTIKEGQYLRYRIVAVDRDADTVRFAIDNSPLGATIDLITGMFSWTPTYEQAGSYRIKFLISDGYDTDDSRSANILVKNVNRAPRFLNDLRDTLINEGDTLRCALEATDPDRDKIYYRTLRAPPGLSIDSINGFINWIPSYDQGGKYLVQFIASDGSLSDTSRKAKIIVANVDRPPVFMSPMSDTTILEEQELNYPVIATDPDADSVTYTLKRGPEGMDLSPQGLLHWRPSFSQAGDYVVTVSARDQELSSDANVRLHVLNIDRPPGSFALHRPADRDTLRLVLSTPVRFMWSRSIDPDADDTLRYELHIWGPRLDTVMHNGRDTTCLANIKPFLQPQSYYRWTVMVTDGMLNVVAADTFLLRTSEGITGSAELISAIPKNYYLEQSLADPFSPTTSIRYALPERCYVKLTIFNMLGESLLVLVSGEKDAGVYDVTFDASDFTSGAYMFRLDAHPLEGNQTKDFVNTKKMFIVR